MAGRKGGNSIRWGGVEGDFRKGDCRVGSGWEVRCTNMMHANFTKKAS